MSELEKFKTKITLHFTLLSQLHALSQSVMEKVLKLFAAK